MPRATCQPRGVSRTSVSVSLQRARAGVRNRQFGRPSAYHDHLVRPGQLVTAASVKLASASTSDANRSFDGTLDPTKATGKVVSCDRGVNARIDKGFKVERARSTTR